MPKADDAAALCEVILDRMPLGPRARPSITYLFEMAIEDLGCVEPRYIGEHELAMRIYKSAQSSGAARTMITRLRQDLEVFFTENPFGRKQKLKIEIEPSSYILIFSRHTPPPIASECIRDFWCPYFQSDRPTCLYYPEPLIFKDARDTRLYHPEATLQSTECFSHLRIESKLTTNHSLVSSGIVRAMLNIFDCFQRNNTPLIGVPIRPDSPVPSIDEDMILIGTPDTMPMISGFEANSRLSMHRDHVSHIPLGSEIEEIHRKLEPPKGVSSFQTHWSLLTRRASRFEGRFITVISGTHPTSVEALSSFITRQNELKSLLHNFGEESFFPDYLQALFAVSLFDVSKDPQIDTIEYQKA